MLKIVFLITSYSHQPIFRSCQYEYFFKKKKKEDSTYLSEQEQKEGSEGEGEADCPQSREPNVSGLISGPQGHDLR